MTKLMVEWTSKILSFSRRGLINESLFNFLHMTRLGIQPSETTFSITLTVCSQSPHKTFGFNLHSLILKKGYPNQFFVSTGLISMYSKFGCAHDARKVFDEMPERDSCVWSSMISGYSQNKLSKEACNLFYGMTKECDDLRGFVNDFAVVGVLNACAHMGYLTLGESVHGYAIKVGYGLDVYVGSSLVDMYAKCDELDCAQFIFDHLGSQDIVIWNTMISGYGQNGYEEQAIELFVHMESQGIIPNYTTFCAVIDASSAMPDDTFGRSLHVKTLKFGILSDVYLGTAIVDMYCKFLNMVDAERAFGEMAKKNVVSYNAVITGYGLIGDHENAFKRYTLLRLQGLKPDTVTFICLFTSCAMLSALFEGVQVHAHAIMLGVNVDVFVGNSIVNLYSKCGSIDCAMKAFETAQMNNVVSWAAIIAGLVQNNESNKALEVFRELCRMSIKVDEFSSSSIINAVTSLAALTLGRHLHGHVIKTGLDRMVYVGSALIDMYSKCGIVEDAHKLFSELPGKNVVAWNSMLTGYAQNSLPNEALLLFQEMEKCGVLPTPVTFVGILLACFHADLVEEGKHFYHLMESHYNISPSVEHCTCMVNLLGRSGYVEEAESFLLNSPFKGDNEIWRSLLSFCEVHKDFDIATRIAERCLCLKPDDSSTYTILSNLYATKHLWSEVGRTRDFMKITGVTKGPGCSWIE